MIVITRDSEETFLRELEFLRERSSDRRCLYIRLSGLNGKLDNWFTILTHALEDIADGHIGQIYIFHDGDVMVVMPHLTDKHMQKFFIQCKNFSQTIQFENLCSLHEIRIDRQFLKSVCERKIETMDARKADIEKQREKDEQKNKSIKAFSELDNSLLESLPHKRRERGDINILVVEDDSLSRMMIKNVLMEDFTVYLAPDAKTAISSYIDLAPDVLFLDIGLPDLDGHHVLERLMEIDPDAYVIMFSGRKDQDSILRSMNAGAMGFVGKPFTRGKLYQYIEQSPGVQEKKNRHAAAQKITK